MKFHELVSKVRFNNNRRFSNYIAILMLNSKFGNNREKSINNLIKEGIK